MNFVFLGPPGSGKGTQAKRLATLRGSEVIIAGDLLRKEVEQGTEIGREIQDILNTGKLVSDLMMTKLIEQEISRLGPDQEIIFDGYPRTLQQAEALDQFCLRKGETLPHVIFFDISTEALTKRLLGRLVCTNCAMVYNASKLPPRREGICDGCGSVLSRRLDDEPHTIHERIRVYEERTEPLIRFYEAEKRLTSIPAESHPDQVFDALCRALSIS